MRLFSKAAAASTDLLGDEHAAKDGWASVLQEADATATLHSLARLLSDRLARGPSPTAAHMPALLWLDRAAEPVFDKVLHQTLQNARMPAAWQETQFARMADHANAMLRAYLTHLQQAMEQASSSLTGDAAALWVARALHHLGLSAKVDYFQNLIPDQNLWRHVHRLYALALQQGFARKVVDGGFGPTTCEDNWLRVVMLASVNQGSLKARQVEQVALWLHLVSIHLVPESVPDDRRHQYYAELEGSAPAQRFHGDAGRGLCCYWGTSELLYRLAIARRLPPVDGNAPAVLSGVQAADLFRRLEQSWTAETAFLNLRNVSRIEARGQRWILGDLEPILAVLRNGVKSNAVIKPEVWALRDMSDNGMGLAVPLHHRWSQLGTLVLVGEGPPDEWALAVVRRAMFEHGATEGKLGLEWLATEHHLVKVEAAGLSGRGGHEALLLELPSGGEGLILAAQAHRAGAALKIEFAANGQIMTREMHEIRVQGDTWVLARLGGG